MWEDKLNVKGPKSEKKRETKTPSTEEQCKRNPMQAIEEVEVKKRDSMAVA